MFAARACCCKMSISVCLVPLRCRPVAVGRLWRSSHSAAATDPKSASTTSDKLEPLPSSQIEPGQLRAHKVDRAMRVYLERARRRQLELHRQQAEFSEGKRHLANMLGVDADTMTQSDIDDAIKYLFPSGLFSLRSRPIMKPPEQVLPKAKDVEFDVTGRPFHSLFYTITPNFYQLLHDLTSTLKQLNEMEAKHHGREAPESLNLAGTRWMELKEMRQHLMESISRDQYDQFLELAEHVASKRFCYLHQEFVEQLRRPLAIAQRAADKDVQATEPQLDKDTGRTFVQATGRRKHTWVTAKVFSQGSGQYTIDGAPLSALGYFLSREQCLAPLLLLQRLTDFDVVVERQRGRGEMALAGAARLAVSTALCPFLGAADVEKLRLAGYLSPDIRQKERKKINQPGARAKWIWKKR